MRHLVVIPQLGGSAALLEPFARAFGDALEVTVLELPGLGDGPAPGGLPSTETLAEHAVARWREVGPPRAALFGISLGGMIAQHVAALAAERVSHLILASTTARALPTSLEAGAGAVLHAVGLAARFFAPGDESAHAAVAEGVLHDDPDAQAFAHDVIEAHPQTRADIAWLSAAAASHDGTAALAALEDVPVTVLTGARDDLIPPDAQAHLAELVGAVQRTLDCGHDLTLEDPIGCARAVLDALAPDTRKAS